MGDIFVSAVILNIAIRVGTVQGRKKEGEYRVMDEDAVGGNEPDEGRGATSPRGFVTIQRDPRDRANARVIQNPEDWSWAMAWSI